MYEMLPGFINDFMNASSDFIFVIASKIWMKELTKVLAYVYGSVLFLVDGGDKLIL